MNLIRLVLSNMHIVVVFLSIIFILLTIHREKVYKDTKRIKEIVRENVLFFWVGIMYTWASIFHIFIPKMGAKNIGWDISPFQKEVGYYDLLVGVGSLLVFTKYFQKFIDGIVYVVSGFSLFAGLNHLYEYIVLKNKSKFNSGLIMYMDLLLPVIMLVSYL